MIQLSATSSDRSSTHDIGRVIAITLLTLVLAGCQPKTSETSGTEGTEVANVDETRSPLEVVNLRMKAYNEHDLAAFLSTYADDVEIFTYPNRSLRKGKKGIKKLFGEMFQDTSLRVEIHHQIAKDGYVINHEAVFSGDQQTEYVSIYEVRKGLIKSVRFVRD